MRKLSLFIIAAGATLGVSVAQAEDMIEAVEAPATSEVVPDVAVDPVPEPETAPEAVTTTLEVEELVLYPVDEAVELPTESGTDGQEPVVMSGTTGEEAAAESSEMSVTSEEGSVSEESAAPDDSGSTEESVVTEESGTGEESVATEEKDTTEESAPTPGEGVKVDDTLLYTTTTDSGPSRGPEGCMECRNLTGMADESAVEAPSPEVMADVLDGNATGVDVMDPVESKKRKQN
jgi:hypothetical protein